jgi:transcription initiation factor TFIID subunit TAF12
MARTAVVSKEVFERVEAVMAKEPMTRQDAFKLVSAEMGKTLGNVSASYYREARNRKKGSTLGVTAGRSKGAVGDRTAELEQLARQLAETAQRMATLLGEQQQQIAEERRRIEKAKQAIIDA